MKTLIDIVLVALLGASVTLTSVQLAKEPCPCKRPCPKECCK